MTSANSNPHETTTAWRNGARPAIAERLTTAAALAAALASLAGFIPGLYRDPQIVVQQSHGYDAANLVVVIVLGLGLAGSARGSLRGRLIAIGALGCLVYSFVTYAFMIVLNPVTLLYIAVLGFGGWAFGAGLARIDDQAVESLVGKGIARRTTAVFLLVIAALFALNWLRQIATSIISGAAPADLTAVGWPMNPVYVLDLGFVLPLAVLAAVRLMQHGPEGCRIAGPLLVFIPLLALSILVMGLFQVIAGQEVAVPLMAIFVLAAVVSTSLAWLALRPERRTGANLWTRERRRLQWTSSTGG